MAVLLVVLQFGTGLLLKFVYEPTPSNAYISVQSLIHDIPFGWLLRNLHHWCAHLLVLIAFFHFLRVFFTGAFHPPRQFNWVLGLLLFLIILMANFTGYLLPWDQLAYWAVTVSAGMLDYVPVIGLPIQHFFLGGDEIGPHTLQVFFAVHTAVVPVSLFFLMGFHFWRIRKAGGLAVAPLQDKAAKAKPVQLPSWPHLLVRELAMAGILIAAVLMLSIFAEPPLSGPANPGLSPNPIKAPWYFAGLQELLLHLHPMVAVCILPILLGLALLVVPYAGYVDMPTGVWFISNKGKRMGMVSAVLGFIATITFIFIDDYYLNSTGTFNNAAIGGFLLLFMLITGILLYSGLLKRLFSATKNEIIQSVFIFLTTALCVLTFFGVCLRGEGMRLALPW